MVFFTLDLGFRALAEGVFDIRGWRVLILAGGYDQRPIRARLWISGFGSRV